MKFVSLVAGALMALAGAPMCQAAEVIQLALRLESGNAPVDTPSVWVKPGEPAAVQAEQRYRLELVAREDGAANPLADVSFRIYLNEGSGFKLVAEPRIKAAFDTPASVSVGSADSPDFKLTMVASHAELPTTR